MVIGLGRFGGRLAIELVELGHEVLGVDADERTVQSYASTLPNVRQADSTDVVALQQLGVTDFNHVVVGIGEVEANILTVAELVALEVRDVWAKAVTESHERILKRIGATHVVLPEHEMGRRIAHQITGKVEEYIELDDGFALVETRVPRALHGTTLGDAGVRARYGVTVVCVKPAGESFTYATPDSVLDAGAMLLIAGEKEAVEAFAEET